MTKLSIFSRGFSPLQVDLKNDPPTYPPTHPDKVVPASYPDVSLSLDENVRPKEGGKETTRECRLYPSHGHLRFITSHSRFALASSKRSA